MQGLITRRKAAYALNQVCREAALGSLAEHFDGEENADWAFLHVNEVKSLKNGFHVATVEIMEGVAVVSVPDSYGLIRGKHQSEFNPMDHGFMPQKLNWLKDPDPYVFHITIPEDIPMLYAPHNPMPRQARTRKPRVRRAL